MAAAGSKKKVCFQSTPTSKCTRPNVALLQTGLSYMGPGGLDVVRLARISISNLDYLYRLFGAFAVIVFLFFPPYVDQTLFIISRSSSPVLVV
jgi:hypothetical protein